jgi:hypothetical protein
MLLYFLARQFVMIKMKLTADFCFAERRMRGNTSMHKSWKNGTFQDRHMQDFIST